MAVIGTGESVGLNTGYTENLALAQRLRERLNVIADNLSRPTCLRPSAYNQQYGAFSILLEMGAAGNSLAEAELAAHYVAEALCDIIKRK
jgi:stage II sporulation protein P